jgi:formate hydrogenlyase transcriptional activator
MANDPCSQATDPSIARYCALFEVYEAIASHRDLSELVRDLAKRLPAVVQFEFIGLILYDPERDVMRIHTLGTGETDSLPPGMELQMKDSASAWVMETQQTLVVSSLDDETRFPKVKELLRPVGVKSFCLLPLTTAVRRLGAIGFGRYRPSTFEEQELEFLQQVARQVAVAVDNALNHERVQVAQQQLARERDRLRLLLGVNNAVVTHLSLEDLFPAVSACLRTVIQHEGSSLVLCDQETGQWRVHVLVFANNENFIEEGLVGASMKSPVSVAISSGKPAMFRERDLKEMSSESQCAQYLLDKGVKSYCSVPLLSHSRVLGALNLGRFSDQAFSPEEVELLSQVAQQITLAVENALSHRKIVELTDKLAKEKLYLEDEIRTEYNFEEIIGDSPALRQVLKQVEVVAPTDSTVLILGETGTGKELIARAIHDRSGRTGRTFVKMNCAAIPTGLLESELFGHEKGAFTGAIAQKVGRFELADGGTLFLDEVGDIPLELQSKLLRVLQEQEFERLGGTKTIKVHVRLVAATNRDLEQMVADKQFRSDLFYRLNIFPLNVPPLRERQEDVSTLVRYFAQKFARRMNKRIETIPAEAMAVLSRYHWPGNIRELENLIERAVILSPGSELRVPLAELKAHAPDRTEKAGTVATLEAAEREHILRALEAAKWVIGGASGAAARLGMKRTTLQSKMQKLNIARSR